MTNFLHPELNSEPTEQQILEDARVKHMITGDSKKDLLALIRYARHIGYNEGYTYLHRRIK